ncbi:MAG: transposase [Planctomycetes bacterium]|nr:transposase [Planctomycetota bacterium]
MTTAVCSWMPSGARPTPDRAAAVQGRIGFGEHSGLAVPRWRDPDAIRHRAAASDRQARYRGLSLQASTAVEAGRNDALERLYRHALRPALDEDRLAWTRDGKVVYRFARPWQDGTGMDNLLRALGRDVRLLPEESAAQSVMHRAIEHLRKHHRRMRQGTFIAMGLPIGSGQVESAVKNLAAHRRQRSGIRWSTAGAQRVLELRTLAEDRRWGTACQCCVDRCSA